jgi:hypothetical protein
MTAGAMALSAAALFGTAHGALTGSSKGCWGHRDVLLTSFGHASCHGPGELAMSTGHAGRAAGYGESDTVLMTGVCGPVPADAIFTWAKAKKLLGIR